MSFFVLIIALVAVFPTVKAAPNHSPQQISVLPAIELEQGTTMVNCVFLPAYFYDPDKDVLSYGWNCSHSTIEVGDDGHINVTAPNDWYGVEYAIMRAVDPYGLMAEGLMQIVVTQVNHPPLIDFLPDLGVRYDQRYDFDIWPYVHDLEKSPEELNYTTNDLNCSFTGTVLSVLYPSSMNDTVNPITITVTDGAHRVSRTTDITVSADYPPVLFPGRLLPDLSFKEDDRTIYPINQGLEYYFVDQEDGQTLDFETITFNANVSAEVFKNETGAWRIALNTTQDYCGASFLLVRAIDSVGAIVEQTVRLDVTPVPDTPVLNLPSTFTVIEGQQIVLSLGEYVSDPDSSMQAGDFTFTVQVINATGDKADYMEWIGVYAGALLFEYPTGFLKHHDDSYTIEVTVTDQTGEVSKDDIVVALSKASGGGNDAFLLTVAVLTTVGGFAGTGTIAYLRRKKPFVVRDFMLVHNDGFLIGRYAKGFRVEEEIDQDIFSGMLTAVLNFVEDSKLTSRDRLNTFGFGDYQILIRRGTKIYSAVVYEGDLPKDIERSIVAFLDAFERVYKKKIMSPTGDVETDFAGVELLIQTFVKQHSKKWKGKADKMWTSNGNRF